MRIHGFMGMSLDGYIADKEGGVGWLDRFQSVDYGYDAFIAGIGAVVMGRATYDQAVGFPGGWPYGGKRGLTVTSRPLEDAPQGPPGLRLRALTRRQAIRPSAILLAAGTVTSQRPSSRSSRSRRPR
jgi:hypothetical protein